MAKSERKIIRGVRVGTKTYVPGQEDELDNVLSSSEVVRLSGKGYIEGKWSGSAKTEEVKEPVATKETKADKKEK